MVIIIILFAGLIFFKYQDWYNSKDHCSYDDVETLREDAQVINLTCNVVGNKQKRRWRTEVYFDDGFRYISHKTDVNNYILGYRISITEGDKIDIIELAVEKHSKIIEQRELSKEMSKQNLEDIISTNSGTALFEVRIYDADENRDYKEIRYIDIKKFPMEKLTHNNTYYVIETFKDGVQKHIFYTKKDWKKQRKIMKKGDMMFFPNI